MSYSPPNTFAPNTVIIGNEVNTNNAALRHYVNVGIITADITDGTVDTVDIVRGEFVGVVPDHQFTSGDMYTQFVDLLRTNELYFTGHTKPYDILGDFPRQILANCGKRIILERPADVLFSVGLLAIGDISEDLFPRRHRNPPFVGHTVGDVLRNSDYIAATKGHAFTEDSASIVLGTPLAAGDTDYDNSGNTTFDIPTTGTSIRSNGFYSRRWYCERMGFTDLVPGVHHFYVAINPRCDKGHLKVVSSQIEVFYQADGYSQEEDGFET